MSDSEESADRCNWLTENIEFGEDADSARIWPSYSLECVLKQYPNRPDQCTIQPRETDEEEALTRWISADEQSFLDAESMR